MQKNQTPKSHKRFMEEYSKCLNIQKAAKNAGFNKKTGAAQAKNYLLQEKNRKALYETILANSEMLQITTGFMVLNYLKILKWASEEDEAGRPRDAALMLKALEGLSKQITKEAPAETEDKEEVSPFISGILNLDTSKI